MARKGIVSTVHFVVKKKRVPTFGISILPIDPGFKGTVSPGPDNIDQKDILKLNSLIISHYKI